MEREIVEDNPVEGLRASTRRRNRTQDGRAEIDAGSKIHPIERPEDVAKLVAAAEAEGGANYLVELSR